MKTKPKHQEIPSYSQQLLRFWTPWCNANTLTTRFINFCWIVTDWNHFDVCLWYL